MNTVSSRRISSHAGGSALWQPVVAIVVATSEEEVAGVRARLGGLGVRVMRVVAPSDARR